MTDFDTTTPSVDLTSESDDRGPEAIFIPSTNKTWGMNEHFNPLGAILNDLGWWVKLEHKEKIVDLCDQKKISYAIDNLPAKDWKTFKKITNKDYLDTLLVVEIDKLGRKIGIDYPPGKIPSLTEEQIADCKKSNDGKKYIKKIEIAKNIQRGIQANKAQERDAVVKLEEEEELFKTFLENDSEKKWREEAKNVVSGIKTGYKINDVDLAFPGGAISIIAAPTSHGKTLALTNFSLGALEENPEINIYFFTYEESAFDIKISFLNTWVSKKIYSINENAPALSKNNKFSILSYFKDPSSDYITNDMRELFLKYKQEYFKEITDSGRLKIFSSDMLIDQLCKLILFIKKNDKKAAMICIDYMQLIRAENYKIPRHEVLKQICIKLKELAVLTGLSIVLAAQCNRTVVSEEDLSPINIGEAGDIERIASLIIGMFNRNFHMMTRSGNTSKDGAKVEKENAIYFEVLKGRKIGNGHSTIMNFDGNKGLLSNKKETILAEFPNMITENSEKKKKRFRQKEIRGHDQYMPVSP